MSRWLAFGFLACLAFQVAVAAPGDVSLARPSATCPNTQLGDEKLQSEYQSIWQAFQEAIEATGTTVENELTRLYEAAKSDGNLDLALFWDGLKKSYAETGQLSWEPTSQRNGWKRFGNADFPDSLADILARCDADYDKARQSLEAGYKSLEVALTKADKLDQALAVRKESQGLWSGTMPKSVVPEQPQASMPPSSKSLSNLLEGLDVEAGRSHDCWKLVGKCLHCTGDGPIGTSFLFQNPHIERLAAKGEYDLSFQIQVLPGKEKNSGEVFILLPGIAASPTLALRYYGTRTPPARVDFSGPFLDGRNQPHIQIPSPVIWDGNKKTTVKVKVRRKGSAVTILFNGRPMIDCKEFPSQPISESLRFNAAMNAKVTICDLTIFEPEK